MPDSSYDYSQYQTSPRANGINLFEKILLVITLIPITFSFVSGFMQQNIKNKELRKHEDIEQLIDTLDIFYANSNSNENERHYPISRCSGQLNEVDYEYTLNYNLTGRNPREDTRVYINPKDFPTDPFGVYSTKTFDRKIPFRNCPAVSKVEKDNIYTYKSLTKSCNFNLTPDLQSLPNCYLYSTTQDGLSYQLGYYSELDKGFIIHSKFKNGPIVEGFTAS